MHMEIHMKYVLTEWKSYQVVIHMVIQKRRILHMVINKLEGKAYGNTYTFISWKYISDFYMQFHMDFHMEFQ